MIKDNKLTFDSKAVKSLIPEEAPSPRTYYETIKNQIVGNKGTTSDLLYFMQVAKRTGLDPTIGQIYAVFRYDKRFGRDKMTIQTGIDGLRTIAERSGQYAGSTEADFEYGKNDKHPLRAKITVYKLNPHNGERMPTTASAKWNEYKPSSSDFMWQKMPETMLAKCAEAKALRKAFPVTQGVYVKEEMEQADAIPQPEFDKAKPDIEEIKKQSDKIKEGLK